MICKLYIFFIFTGINFICCASKRDSDQREEALVEQILIDIHKEDHSQILDPNNMLADPKLLTKENMISSTNFESSISGSCHYENRKFQDCNEQLEVHFAKISHLEFQLEEEKKKSLKYQKQKLKDDHIDFKAFYFRFLHKFWTLLEMEKLEKILQTENELMVRHLVAHITASDIVVFKDSFEGNDNMLLQIDEFFQYRFKLEERKNNGNILYSLLDSLQNLLRYLNRFEVWLTLSWFLLLGMGLWALSLFIQDTLRKLRWERVFAMMLILAFLISCIIHWRHMIKVAEAKRQSFLMETEFIGGKCKEDDSYFSLFRASLFGGATSCEKYYEDVMITPDEEISPMMVLTETCSRFILLPLTHLGRHSGLFFKNFYENIPWIWQIPSTICFIFIFTIFIMGFFGYGIYFPLWLGGIRPTRLDDTIDIKQLIKDSEENMKIQNCKLINEAKEMLAQISEAAISHVQNSTSQKYLEPIVQRSSNVIECKLEHLINEKFSNTFVFGSSIKCDKEYSTLSKDKVDGAKRKSIIPLEFQCIQNKFHKISKENTAEANNDFKNSSSSSFECLDLHVCSSDSPENEFVDKVKSVFEENILT